MLATLVDRPFHSAGWVYEEKYDGYRILAYKEGAKVTLLSRNGNDRTATFASVAASVAKLRDRSILLDGEVVAFDRHGVSRFQLLQRGDVDKSFAVFDVLYRNGRDLRREPLASRRDELVEAIGKESRELFVSKRLAGNGLQAYRIAQRRKLEGVVAKDLAAPYEEKRSRAWLKVKVHQEEEFVIAGYTPPRGSRQHIGALLLGAYAGDDLHFVGKVGTGFTQARLAELYARFKPLIRATSLLVDPPRGKGLTWLTPKLVAQIAFAEWTSDRKLRQPVFLGLHDDKSPRECVLPS
ncbi:MAG TPA: non-homologous end-joining DNA ligase [Candidatus Binataceae bacterium]|nr:non-homologous end-joining DNA ligase [Candidatus Binataceae bacterium]